MEPTTALVFDASGEQGRAVLEGFVDGGYAPVYGFTSNNDTLQDQYLSDALQCVLLEGRLGDPDDVRKALTSTKAQTIFLATTTEMPVSVGGGYQSAQEDEYNCIIQFFSILKQVYLEDGLARTVVFSTRDNVQELCAKELEQTGQTWIEPLDDGSVVPHFSAKGKGGEMALKLLEDSPKLELILLSVPFFYSNFLAFFAPLPNKGKTQWELCASFGDGANIIDMMSCGDLGRLVVAIFGDSSKYNHQNLRVASERICMDEIAKEFSDLYGKDVIYNPLLPQEVAAMEFASAPAMAQMCQFLGTKHAIADLQHSAELTSQLLTPREPTKFKTWLLTHNDANAFSRVGLNLDAPELIKICVFGALSAQGKSAVKGLLADKRKSYEIRATTRRDLESCQEVQEMIHWGPKRISFVHADFDDVASCQAAVEGMDGAFLAADFRHEITYGIGTIDLETEEKHVRNIIDACEGRIKHLVFSTMENSEIVTKDLPQTELLEFSPKARAAAYARSKQLSVTFLLIPCYSENEFNVMDVRADDEDERKMLPSAENGKVMCKIIEELGTAVASIFDSYQCYAGHEIGLMTDFVTVSEVQDAFLDVFTEHTLEAKTMDTIDWAEVQHTYMKDLGQLFAAVSHSDDVVTRNSTAKTFHLLPSAKNLRRWVEQNKDDPSFREKLGLR